MSDVPAFEQSIVLTGFMGAGKTAVGAALARQLNCEAIDLDKLIAGREKRSAAEIIVEDGEAHFRSMETNALREVLERNMPCVISLGGGAWGLSENRVLINEHGCLTIWLDASFELCWQRITRDKEARPMAGSRSRARRLYDERRPLYQLAQLRVNVNLKRSAFKVATEIVEALR
jgi:shikimate kinase